MAQAVRAVTPSTFFAKLLAPASPRDDRRFLRELHAELEQAWGAALHRFYAAQAWSSYAAHMRRAVEVERGRDYPETSGERNSQLAMLEAVNRMMHVPAPTIGALRHKQKLRRFDGGRDRWEAAIAADEERLGRS